ncbi:MAG: phosphatidylglycerol lysyltransferase domain-containing protein [Actinomycetota bacterium]|nr:phosphatidylglycerol lysyltransferase domain-containing protein [Actinomycetota bacterium]
MTDGPEGEATAQATGGELVDLASRRPTVVDEVPLSVAIGGQVLVFGGLRLVPGGTDTSREIARAIAHAVERCRGPAVIVFAGDTFDMLRDGRPDPELALAAHPRLATALAAFLESPERRIVALPGIRDAALAYDARTTEALQSIGWIVSLACVLEIDTGAGVRLVRVEPGHQLDPATAFHDPRDPNDHPLVAHLEREVLPGFANVGDASHKWLEGIEDADPADMGALVASRFTYRRLFRRAAWLTLPVLASLALFFPVVVFSSRQRDALVHIFRLLAAGFAIELVLLAVALAFVVAQLHDSLGSISWLSRALRDNDLPRGVAVGLAAGGGAGLVTGHSGRAELTDLGGGAFYANCGTAGRTVDRVDTRGGLPAVYAARLRCSWVELEAGSELRARLWHGARDLPERTLLERMASRERMRVCWPPAEVAEHPGTVTWPSAGDATAFRRRTRRIAAAAIAFAGVLNLASAVTVPIASRLTALGRFTPIEVPEVAAALVAICGIGLILLARGVRRGQRHAWLLAHALLLLAVVGNVIKGLDIEEAIIALLVVVFLLVHRDDFAAPANPSSWRRGLGAALLAIAVAIIGGTTGVALRHPKLALPKIAEAVAGRLVGLKTVALPNSIDRLVSPALLAVGVAIALAFCWLLFRPAVSPRLSSYRPLSRERARYIVEQYGVDSLSYFALRDDKEWFGFRDTLVAYRVHNGIALVSPDPIGPVGQRAEAWGAFREFADEHGWPVAVMGACADWLPAYRASGMHDLYIGDEAVVDVRRFRLDGKQNKSLRQSVGRVEKAGYRVEFFDPSRLAPDMEAKLRDLMTESRRGDVERGFSMTLGRVFEPDDRGLLLAVALDREDRPAGFCQYVPARAIEGWSLDLMRRSEASGVPNGITELIVAKTIEHLRLEGSVGLALNFATFRAVLASEAGDRLVHRAQKWILERVGDSMQIESLWTFNEKFQPDWHARYAAYDSPEHLLSASIAVARAESFIDLPIIGRFFKPADEARERPRQLPVEPAAAGKSVAKPRPPAQSGV